MDKIVLEPEPKTSRCRSWGQNFGYLQLVPEILSSDSTALVLTSATRVLIVTIQMFTQAVNKPLKTYPFIADKVFLAETALRHLPRQTF